MVAHAVLAVVAALALVGTAGAAAVGTGMFHSGGNSTFDLGVLNPGQSGNTTITSTVQVNSSANYSIHMDRQDRIGSVFSSFRAYASINGNTYNLTGCDTNLTSIPLSAGNHTFVITLVYSVRDNVTAVNETAIPFVFLQSHQRNDKQAGNQAGDYSEGGQIPAAGGSHRFSEHGGELALAYLTFKTNGNIPNHLDDGGADASVVQSTIMD